MIRSLTRAAGATFAGESIPAMTQTHYDFPSRHHQRVKGDHGDSSDVEMLISLDSTEICTADRIARAGTCARNRAVARVTFDPQGNG